MALDEAALAAELTARHGVTTTTRLARLGIARRTIDTLKHRGRLRLAAQGVLVSTTWPDTLEHRMAVACAATDGVVCFPTAGIVWQLRKTPRCADIYVAVPEGRRIDPLPGVVIKRTCLLAECDIVQRDDGIEVTTPPRTVFDAAWSLSDDDLESLIEDGLHRGYFIVPTLQALGRRMRSRGRPGSKRFREVLDGREPARRAVASDYELRLERALRKRGFSPLERQCRVELGDGNVIHPDLGLPAHGFYIEVDHRTWHDGRFESDYDCRRDLAVEALGHHVVRVSDLAIDLYLDATVEALWEIWQRVLRSRVHTTCAPCSAEPDERTSSPGS
jgi:very-short-patch-repair endonuclease